MADNLKRFKVANRKLKKLEERLAELRGCKVKAYAFGTLSGHTCKAAVDCLAWVGYDPATGAFSTVAESLLD